MDYVFGKDNIVLDAALSMTNAVGSNAIERKDEAPKAGGGDVALTGPYTGAANVTVDVRIADEEIEGTPSASAPQFVGVGNGTMTVPTGADGMLAETFVLTVENLGTETRYAEAQFQGAKLRATTPGPRSIRIEITPELTMTETDVALREAIPQDADVLDGDHWNIGAAVLTGDGDVPADAPRRRIGIEPTVFRQVMKWDSEKHRYVYVLSPRPPRAIPAGAIVRAVIGTYTMRVIEDDTIETYTGLVTLYDALDALRSRSAIVKPLTPVVADHRPGGMAAVDLSVITTSYCATITADGGEGVQRGDILLVVGPNAPTEVLSLVFVESDTIEVRGEISGLLGRAKVGETFTSAHYSFRVPRPPTDPAATGAQTILILKLAPRDGGPVPALCSYLTRPGINLRNGATKWVWGPMPPAPCDCSGLQPDNGPPDDSCLGIETEETTVSEASRMLRMQRVATWVREFVANNTYLYGGFENDVALVKRGAEIVLKSLDSIIGATLNYPAWSATKSYKIDEIVEPTIDNGFRYAVSSGGTSGTTEPTWPTTIGDTVTSDGITWTCAGKKPLAMWDDSFRLLQLDAASLFPAHSTAGSSAQIWTANQVTNGDVLLLPTTDNGHYYAWVSGTWPGSLGPTEPAWTTDGSDVTVGDFVYRDVGAYGGLQRSTAYAVDAVVYSVYHGVLRCIASSGPTAATMPSYAGLALNDTFVDGGVTWKITSGRTSSVEGNASFPVAEAFWARHEAIANDVRAAAGVKGNFTESSGTERCWTSIKNPTGAFWYAGSDEPGYMPVWGNHWNVMAKEGPDGIYSTMEGAFMPLISCPENLVTGDELTRIVTGVTGTGSGWYQQGDKWRCEITAAGPVRLGGGQIGNDTTTISVVGTQSGRLRDYLLYRPAPAPYDGRSDAWAPSAVYAAGAFVRPTTANGFRYQAGSGGTSGTTEPTWPTTIGDTVTSDGITWTCAGPDTAVSFTIAEGGIRFSLEDQFTFAFEGGHFEWRISGGAWQGPLPIAPTVALVDGLVATFAGGLTPSWKTADAWAFDVTAVAGVENLRRPTGRSARWVGSTAIDVTPADARPVTRLVIAGHDIPSTATITLQGSDDDFATTPLNIAVPWRAGDIHVAVPAPRARYRLLIDAGGSIYWLFLGDPFRPTIRTGHVERGTWEPDYRMPTPIRRGGVGGRISHTWLPQAVWEALRDRFAAASLDDQCRFAVIPNTAEPAVHLVALAGEVVPLRDDRGFAPRDSAERRLAVDFQVEAA